MIICDTCGYRNFFKPGDSLICECGKKLDKSGRPTRFDIPKIKQPNCLSDEIPDKECGDYSEFYSYPK